LGDQLILLLEDSVWSVAYLPQEGSVGDEQGRQKFRITHREGPVGLNAWTTIETPAGEMVVWLSRTGLRWSDGRGFDDACPDWSIKGAELDATLLDEAVLVADPRNGRIRAAFPQADDSTILWDFYYHPTLLKDGAHGRSLRVLGPTVRSTIIRGGFTITNAGIDRVMVWNAGGVYREDLGFSSEVSTVESGFVQLAATPFVNQRIGRVGVWAGPGESIVDVLVQAEDGSENEAQVAPTQEGHISELLPIGVSGRRVNWKLTVAPSGQTEWSLLGVDLQVASGLTGEGQ